MADEDDDRMVGFLNRDGMAQAVVFGDARRHDLSAGIVAAAEHCGNGGECAQQTQASTAIDCYFFSHRSVPQPRRCSVSPSQSMIKPKLHLQVSTGSMWPAVP